MVQLGIRVLNHLLFIQHTSYQIPLPMYLFALPNVIFSPSASFIPFRLSRSITYQITSLDTIVLSTLGVAVSLLYGFCSVYRFVWLGVFIGCIEAI